MWSQRITSPGRLAMAGQRASACPDGSSSSHIGDNSIFSSFKANLRISYVTAFLKQQDSIPS